MSAYIHRHLTNGATLHPKHTLERSPRLVRERQSLAASYAPSARDLFAALLPILHESRPIHKTRDGRTFLGKPTFRNVILDGKHV